MKIIDRIKSSLVPKELRDPAALSQVVQDFARKLETTGTVTAPLDRLNAALKVESELQGYGEKLNGRLNSGVEKAKLMVYGAFFALGALVGVALFGVVGLPAACGVALTFGASTGVFGMIPTQGLVDRFLRRRVSSHREALEGVAEQAADLVNKTIEKHAVDLAFAPGFADTCRDSWRVSNAFALAFNKAALSGDVQRVAPIEAQQVPSNSLNP